jgi:MFS family permease
MFLWGVATVGQGLVQNQPGLIAMRLLLGLFEAGFFPGSVYLISMYYKRYELQWRLNLFFCGAILAGAFSGLLAYAIANLDGLAGYRGWRWIFIMCVPRFCLSRFVLMSTQRRHHHLRRRHRVEVADSGLARDGKVLERRRTKALDRSSERRRSRCENEPP